MIFALYGTWEALVWGKILLRGVRLIFQILKNYNFEFRKSGNWDFLTFGLVSGIGGYRGLSGA